MTTTLPFFHTTLVDPRTGERLRAIGWTRRGPVWPVMGGAPDDDPDPDGDPDDPAEDPPKDPKDKGPKGGPDALKADLAEERKKRQALEKRVEALKPLEELVKSLSGDPDKDKPTDIDAIKERLEAQDKATAAANMRAVDAEIRAAATGFIDLDDALANIGDKSRFLKADGDIDTKGIETALAAVLEKKPHLAKKDADPPKRRGPRDPGQGAGNGSDSGSVKSGRDLYAQRNPKKTSTT